MSQTPMDYSYDNGTGPLDTRSPFVNLEHNVQRFPGSAMSSPSKRSTSTSVFGSGRTLMIRIAGAQNGFGSPSKQRTMGAVPSTPSKQQPLAAYNALFTTPRNTNKMDIDDSSAGETPRSPDRDADSEATPEIKSPRGAKPKLDVNGAPTLAGAERTQRSSPTKEKQRPREERRDSWVTNAMNKVKNKFNSPGRSTDIILRSDNPSRIEKSVSRRRRQEIDRVHRRKRRHSVSDSEADGDYHPPSSPRKGSNSQPTHPIEKEPHWMRSLFSFIADHPTVPQILSFYAQLAFNFFLLAFCAYIIWCCWATLNADVDREAEKEIANIIMQQAACVREWHENKCEPETRVRQVEKFCEEKERCMNQDPYKVGRARVSAHTFAGIFNSFVEPISYKAMAFTFILVFGCFAVRALHRLNSDTPDTANPNNLQISNLAFGIVRNKANQYQQGPYQQQHYGFASPPPPTPQRTFSGQGQDGFYQKGTPWHQPYPGLEPQPSGGFGQIDGQGSPVRRLKY